MLELKNIRKAYTTDSFTQVALDDVSVTFRDNEFVAILGPSGSGKTTMLNILGGLDHADSGDIVINGISTKDYGDKDWDTYRNHRVGFIFQSYNLIPHQSVLSNVELALTLSGVGRAERKARALAALEDVGLGEHAHKRPAQLSGGQMQRVAIARALVNNPNIVLADEPTGALDTETGVQVMNILKDVAKDRLVVMVTHNPELAQEYATRIVRVKDGRIEGDSDPIALEDSQGEGGSASPAADVSGAVAAGTAAAAATTAIAPNQPTLARDRKDDKGRRASMSFLTALSLSFNNLMTKKGRTFMTAFAGSIGIIGIAAILALSNGVNNYIAKTEEEALSSYPLTITKSSFDMTQLMGYSMGGSPAAGSSGAGQASSEGPSSGGGRDVIAQQSIMTDMFAQVKNNDLAAFKSFLEGGGSGIEPYVNTIQYSYGITPQVFSTNTANGITRLNPSKMSKTLSNGIMGSSLTGGSSMTSFDELVDDRRLLESQMELVHGSWPEAVDECVLVLDRRGGISDYTLYALGFYDTSVMDDMITNALAGKDAVAPEQTRDFTVEDALGMTFSVVPAADLYQKNVEQGTWTDMSSDADYMRARIEQGIHLRVVGIIKPAEGSGTALVREGIAYTHGLTDELMSRAASSEIVREQRERPDVDVFTGKTFEELRKKDGASFDLSQAFTVDEAALANAFSVDMGALDTSSLSGGLDLTSLGDLSSGFDASKIELDSSAMAGVLSEESIAKIMAGAPRFSLEDAGLADAASGLTADQQKALNAGVQKLMAGYGAWAMLHPTEAQADDAMQRYLATDDAKPILAEMNASLGTAAGDIVNQAMQRYMTEQFAPYFSAQMQGLMTQAGQVMATQLAQQLQVQMAAATQSLGSQLSGAIAGQLAGQMSTLTSALREGFSFDADAFANAIHFNMTQEDLTSLLTNYMNAAELTYDSNMSRLGYASADSPESISIYPKDFAAKQSVLDVIDAYNREKDAQGQHDATIQYSDIAGALMSSVTDIVNMVSMVLIAFVSISLVVSSIMIGIITYISVLERKKEIGILRAMGASKLNVANVFNAETIIEGLIAGVFAILTVVLLSIPVNAIVLETQGVADIMILPWASGLVLIGVSVLLTFLGGLLPSTRASKNDPVEALRSE